MSHAGYSCISRARARVRSIGKIKCFLIVTIFVGRRIARQPSALRTVVRPDVRLSIGSVRQGRPATVFREPQVQRRSSNPEAPSSLCQVSIAGADLGQNCLALGLTQIPRDRGQLFIIGPIRAWRYRPNLVGKIVGLDKARLYK